MKKGILATNILDFFAYMSFVLVIIIFYLVFYFGAERLEYNPKSISVESDAGLVLLNIMRTPVDSESNIADLLVKSVQKNNFGDFEARVKPILQDYFTSNFDECQWRLQISKASQTLYELETDSCTYEIIKNRIFLPNANPRDSNLEVTLTLCESLLVGGPMGAPRLKLSSQPCTYKS
jgi:hypothetical protein